MEKKECIFFNGFQRNDIIIPWHDLLLLEGKPVHFPAPKSHFSYDILLDADILKQQVNVAYSYII